MVENNEAIDPVEVKSLKVRDIEPLLKWGAVAYAGGFLTVMLHTHHLASPSCNCLSLFIFGSVLRSQ